MVRKGHVKQEQEGFKDTVVPGNLGEQFQDPQHMKILDARVPHVDKMVQDSQPATSPGSTSVDSTSPGWTQGAGCAPVFQTSGLCDFSSERTNCYFCDFQKKKGQGLFHS